MHFEYKIAGGDFSKAGYASSEVKKILKQLNVEQRIIKRIVVALYEGEVNIVAHAYHGKAIIDITKERVEIYLWDMGPGIEDIPKAMEKGYSTASNMVREMGFGAGMGLNNMENNSDKLDIKSEVGQGTEVRMTINLSNSQ